MVKNPPANAGDAGDRGSTPESERSPRVRKWQPPPVFLPGRSHGQRSLVGYSPWGHKESGTTEHTCICEVQRALWEGVSKASTSLLHTFRGVSLYHLSC